MDVCTCDAHTCTCTCMCTGLIVPVIITQYDVGCVWWFNYPGPLLSPELQIIQGRDALAFDSKIGLPSWAASVVRIRRGFKPCPRQLFFPCEK